MAVFEAGDIVEVAVRIEENGANFYRYAEQLAGREEVKALFRHLAEEEVKHQKTFAEILAGMERNLPPEGYDGEYAAYLHNYVDNKLVFTAEAFAKEMTQIRPLLPGDPGIPAGGPAFRDRPDYRRGEGPFYAAFGDEEETRLLKDRGPLFTDPTRPSMRGWTKVPVFPAPEHPAQGVGFSGRR